MRYFKRFQAVLSIPVLTGFLLSTLPLAAVNATMIGTEQMITQSTQSPDRDRVIQFLEREDVIQEMQSLGVSPEEAKQRAMALSDSEIQQLAGKIEMMPAGEGAVESAIGALVLIFLVLLFTDILCLTDVFDFARCAR